MKAPDCLFTKLLFCIVYEGTSLESQNMHTIDKPGPVREDKSQLSLPIKLLCLTTKDSDKENCIKTVNQCSLTC